MTCEGWRRKKFSSFSFKLELSTQRRFLCEKKLALVQEGRSKEAEGRREESFYSKLLNLFELVGYFCRTALASLRIHPSFPSTASTLPVPYSRV
jgi:hypothetical protein